MACLRVEHCSVNAVQCELNRAEPCWPSSLCKAGLARTDTGRVRSVNANRAVSELSMRIMQREHDNHAPVN